MTGDREPSFSNADEQTSNHPEPAQSPTESPAHSQHQLIILTGMSGAGKQSALRAFEDLGYYSVDNLPLELIPQFAELVSSSSEIYR
ncbi:MAG: RNase adaptor protein RapZ, partial [Terriglobus roseus]|nr:RNase adaptor protein RapZ [Terriglobus roseus]